MFWFSSLILILYFSDQKKKKKTFWFAKISMQHFFASSLEFKKKS